MMRYKDYNRLAKISIKSRKQSSRSTVRGIAFGMILLIPVLFIVLGFHMGVLDGLNKHPDLLYASATFASERSGISDSKELNIYSYQRAESLQRQYGDSGFFLYDQIIGPCYERENLLGHIPEPIEKYKISVGGGELKSVMMRSAVNTAFAAIINKNTSGEYDFIPKNINAKYGGDIFLEGFSGGFEGDGKKQIIVSEMFLDIIGIEPEQAYGNTLSLNYLNGNSGCIYLDNDFIPNNAAETEPEYTNEDKQMYLFKDYEVAGIIKQEVTKYAQDIIENEYQKNHILSNMVFLTDASAALPGGGYLEPEINPYEGQKGRFIATYTYNDEDFNALNSEYIALGTSTFSVLAMNKYTSDDNRVIYPEIKLFYEADSYDGLVKFTEAAAIEFSHFFTEHTHLNVTSNLTNNFFFSLYMLSVISKYLIIFLLIMGGIVFFAAMVNLFNSIAHSIDTRRHYLGVMRAVGAKSGVIPRLYFSETLILFKRAVLWIIIFSSAICVGLKKLTDMLFQQFDDWGTFPVSLEIDLIYLPVSIIAGLALLTALGLLFSYSLSRSVSKRPIMSILGEN